MSWYISFSGRAEGPFTDDELKHFIEAGQLTLVDLIFKVGGTRWQIIGEIPELKALYARSLHKEPVPEPELLKSQEWVVLRKLEGETADYYQDGPFSTSQIDYMLSSGRLSYSEYIWRADFEHWVRIGNLHEFDRRDQSRDEIRKMAELEIPEINFEEITKSATHFDTFRGAQIDLGTEDEVSPPEARGADLIESDLFPTKKFNREITQKIRQASLNIFSWRPGTQSGVPARAELPGLNEQPTDQPESWPRNQPTDQPGDPLVDQPGARDKVRKVHQRLWRRNSTAAVFMLLVLATTLVILNRWRNLAQTTQEPAVPLAKAALQKDKGAGELALGADPNLEPPLDADSMESVGGDSSPRFLVAEYAFDLNPTPTHLPLNKVPVGAAPLGQVAPSKVVPIKAKAEVTWLQLKSSNLATDPVLVIKSDMPLNEPVEITIKARAGDIAKPLSYQRQWLLKKTQSGDLSLRLRDEDLPSGTYGVRVRVRDKQDFAKIFLGRKDKAFREGLERQLKQSSFEILREKRALLGFFRELESRKGSLKSASQDSTTLARIIQSRLGGFLKNLGSRPNELAFPDEFNRLLHLSGAADERVLTAEDIQSDLIKSKRFIQMHSVYSR